MTMPQLTSIQRTLALTLATATLTGAVLLGGISGSPAHAQASVAPAPAVSAANPVVPELAAIRAPGADGTANPYGLRAVWAQGDAVARTTLLILALMSMGSWYVIIAKMLEQRRLVAQALSARSVFSGTVSLRRATDALAQESPFRLIVEGALDSVRQHEALAGQVDMASWLSQDIVRSIANLTVRAQAGMSALATVGSTAPFVGLFGTVWGIYNALITIGATGQASIDKVAGPVGEALIMTALGLAVAVPAVLGYNWLVRRNRVAMHHVKAFGSDLHTVLLIEVDKGRRADKQRRQEG